MRVNYKQYQQNVGRYKVFKVLGWILLIAGILVFITNMLSFINWKAKQNNYIKKYVYSEFGTLSYELDGEKVYIQEIYNTDNEKISIDIPDNETIIMYINKDNISEGIYFDLGNATEKSMLNPIIIIYVSLLLVAMGSYLVGTKKEVKEKNYY